MSDVFAFPFATLSLWRWLYAITPLLCVVTIMISPFLLESPRWLLSRDEGSGEARVVIKQLRGFRTEAEVSFFHTYIHTCAFMLIHTYIHMLIYICSFMYLYVHTFIYIYIYVCINIYIHIYTFVHVGGV